MVDCLAVIGMMLPESGLFWTFPPAEWATAALISFCEANP